MTTATLDIIPRSLSFDQQTGGTGAGVTGFPSSLTAGYGCDFNYGCGGHMGMGMGGGLIEANIYTPDPTVVMCLLENGIVVEVEVTTETTFVQLNQQALLLARDSPLYCSSEFEDPGAPGGLVEFTMIYFTQFGDEKHGQPGEKILNMLYDSDVTEMGPLLSVIKFEKKSSGWDEYSRLASVLHCDVEDIRAFVDVLPRELPNEPLRCLKEIEVEVQHFRRSAHVVALDALRDRVKHVNKESQPNKKYLTFLKTAVVTVPALQQSTSSSSLQPKPKIDSALYEYLSQCERNVELLHDEGSNNPNSASTGPSPLLAVIQDVNYLTATVSQILSKAIPLTCEGPGALVSNDLNNPGSPKTILNAVLSKTSSSSSNHLIRNSKYILKVFGSEIYFTEDVILLEVPEVVEQLTKSFYAISSTSMGGVNGPSATLRLVLCDKQSVVEKYNFAQFQESCMKLTEITQQKKELEKMNDKQEKLLCKEKSVSVSTLSSQERYYFHPTAVMLGDEVEAELRGGADNYWIEVTTYLTFGDKIITQFSFPSKRKKEALWGSQEEIDKGKTQIPVNSLPRSATLCFIVYISKTQVPQRYDLVKKFWANFCIFDFYGYLKTGPNNLHLWELPQDQVVIYQPNLTGTTIDNLKTFQKKKSTGVRLIINCMAGLHNNRNSYFFETPLQQGLNVQWLNNITLQTHIKLSDISTIDDMSAAEKAWIFKQAVEYYYQGLHNSENIFSTHKLLSWLPQIVKSVDFSDADMVQNLKLLLQKCKPPEFVLKTDQCLVLLGFHCQDLEVRNFAVQHLNQKPVSELKSYLLQICECLKFERYLTNELSFMLLRKCFDDHTFAHALFWNLRIFLFDETHWLRTSLIIEAMFTGIPDYRYMLEKPLTIVEKMRFINCQLKTMESDKQKHNLDEYLRGHLALMDQWLCPLCPSKFLSSLEPHESKCMKSKMKPIRLVYNTEDFVIRSEDYGNGGNMSPLTPPAVVSWNNCKKTLGKSATSDLSYELMFKIGDDLRQDVLMLQMFACFNDLWMQQDLDLKLRSYKCVAAEVDAGFIEMVQDASTISKIQKWYNEEKKGLTFGAVSAAWSKDAIYLWLASDTTKKPPTSLPEESVKKAVDEFVLSCAGSCVASYVLGIGDRHNDNIMVHRTGRLFHIDFGHILGRKKQKFGINRERVPLILPASFMYIINKDFETSDTSKPRNEPQYRKNFDFFRDLCVRAFLVLRENVDMICNILYAMKDAGMPELKSIDDVNYVRETLFTSDPVEEAEKKFIQKINESIKSSWTTNVNWAFHNRQHWR